MLAYISNDWNFTVYIDEKHDFLFLFQFHDFLLLKTSTDIATKTTNTKKYDVMLPSFYQYVYT